MGGKARFQGETGGKAGSNLEKNAIFTGNSLEIVPENVKKPFILTFFKHFSKFAPIRLLDCGVDLTSDLITLCVYY